MEYKGIIILLIIIIVLFLLQFWLDYQIERDFEFYEKKYNTGFSKKYNEKNNEICNTIINLYNSITEEELEQEPNFNINNNSKIVKSDKKTELIERIKQPHVIKNILSKQECDWIIYESELFAKERGWEKEEELTPVLEIDCLYINNINYYLRNLIYRNIFPHYGTKYNIPSEYLGIDSLRIIKYDYNGEGATIPHVDAYDFSFVITLNADFEGGGTYFIRDKILINPPVGDVLIFCGRNMHTSVPITKGTRYILVGFLSLKYFGRCETIIGKEINNEFYVDLPKMHPMQPRRTYYL